MNKYKLYEVSCGRYVNFVLAETEEQATEIARWENDVGDLLYADRERPPARVSRVEYPEYTLRCHPVAVPKGFFAFVPAVIAVPATIKINHL